MDFDYTSTRSGPSAVTYPNYVPMSIAEIAAAATHFDYNPLIPLKYWLRTAENLRREVCLHPSSIPLSIRPY